MEDAIGHYFQNLKNPAHHDDLQRLRAFVKAALPQAEEVIAYGMPAYSQNEQLLVAFASQRRHMSLYLDTDLVEQHSAELAHLDHGKGCVRFRKLEALPLDTIQTILQETVERRAR
jgi:uncharacterized protein YdhG (YjbR/CyaY superfamily)